jgi:hypothetical protein
MARGDEELERKEKADLMLTALVMFAILAVIVIVVLELAMPAGAPRTLLPKPAFDRYGR